MGAEYFIRQLSVVGRFPWIIGIWQQNWTESFKTILYRQHYPPIFNQRKNHWCHKIKVAGIPLLATMMHTVFFNSCHEFDPQIKWFLLFHIIERINEFCVYLSEPGTFQISNSFIPGWELHGLHCYQFFNVRHSWQKASELCKRYGSDLATVDSFAQNNFTSQLASRSGH